MSLAWHTASHHVRVTACHCHRQGSDVHASCNLTSVQDPSDLKGRHGGGLDNQHAVHMLCGLGHELVVFPDEWQGVWYCCQVLVLGWTALVLDTPAL